MFFISRKEDPNPHARVINFNYYLKIIKFAFSRSGVWWSDEYGDQLRSCFCHVRGSKDPNQMYPDMSVV
jgi:hypothetical protein